MKSNGNLSRVEYLSQLRTMKDTGRIKILTGIRMCGKSTIMKMFISSIISSGVPKDNVLYINLDTLDTIEPLPNATGLLNMIKERIEPCKGKYIFIDEVQNVSEWETVVESLRTTGADVYVTISDSKTSSIELSDILSEKCVVIPVYPLSFSEYIQFRNEDESIDDLFDDYVRYGGMPGVARIIDFVDATTTSLLLSGIYNTIMNKNVLERNMVKSIPTMMSLSKFIMGDVGNKISIRGITDHMTDAGVKTNRITVNEYLGHLEAAFVIMKCRRLDLKTKDHMTTYNKLYVTDLGLRHSVIPFSSDNMKKMLENIVYMELLRRYKDVSVYSIDETRSVFVADSVWSPMYYYVTTSLSDPDIMRRELKSLKMIDDNHPRMAITYDEPPMNNIDGIKIARITDWLLGSKGILIDGREKPEKTLKELQNSCFGINDMTEKDLDYIIENNPYVFSKLKNN